MVCIGDHHDNCSAGATENRHSAMPRVGIDARTTGDAYAWVVRRLPPAITAAWAYVMFMVGIEGWANVSFGPVALTAAAGVALVETGGR